MKKINNTKSNKDKFLCYCSKITHKKFKNELYSKDYIGLDALCNQLELAKHCASCLPNIEDEFFQLKGKNHKVKNIIAFDSNFSLLDRIKSFVDSLCGDKLVSLQGHLPMIVSKCIKTWLIISNEKPSVINSKITPYKIELVIFDKKGNIVKKITQLINIYKSFKICLNEHVPPPKNSIESYYVKLLRSPIKKGFRGSTRPHFFYETPYSMSALHTQDGARKKNFVYLPLSKNKDKNMLFIINPSRNKTFIKPKVQIFFNGKIKKEVKLKNFTIPSQGSKILVLDEIKNTNEKHLLQCESLARVKCYFIIADKNFKNISVDHI